MTDEIEIHDALDKLADEDFCYLTTMGRVSGNPHEIEIWFGAQDDVIYLMSGGGRDADWVKNLIKNPGVTVRIGNTTFTAIARLVIGSKEEAAARLKLAEKYHEWENSETKTLSEWAKTALVVGIDLNSILKSA